MAVIDHIPIGERYANLTVFRWVRLFHNLRKTQVNAFLCKVALKFCSNFIAGGAAHNVLTATQKCHVNTALQTCINNLQANHRRSAYQHVRVVSAGQRITQRLGIVKRTQNKRLYGIEAVESILRTRCILCQRGCHRMRARRNQACIVSVLSTARRDRVRSRIKPGHWGVHNNADVQLVQIARIPREHAFAFTRTRGISRGHHRTIRKRLRIGKHLDLPLKTRRSQRDYRIHSRRAVPDNRNRFIHARLLSPAPRGCIPFACQALVSPDIRRLSYSGNYTGETSAARPLKRNTHPHGFARHTKRVLQTIAAEKSRKGRRCFGDEDARREKALEERQSGRLKNEKKGAQGPDGGRQRRTRSLGA